jgi:oligopeptide transport system ATP-binding protein
MTDNLSQQQILVCVKQLRLYFPVGPRLPFGHLSAHIKAVDDISFDVYRGETLGLVGESGCGKTTAGRAILQLYRPTAGEVIFRGVDMVRQSHEEVRRARRYMQMIFQDPYASLNPHMRIGEIRLRRAHLGPRRLHPGPDHQSAAATAGGAASHLSVHRP